MSCPSEQRLTFMHHDVFWYYMYRILKLLDDKISLVISQGIKAKLKCDTDLRLPILDRKKVCDICYHTLLLFDLCIIIISYKQIYKNMCIESMDNRQRFFDLFN